MRGKGLNRWRPIVGAASVAALCCTLQVVASTGQAGIEVKGVPGVSATTDGATIFLVGQPFNGDLRSVSAVERGVEHPGQGGVAGGAMCTCDGDCGDGNACTIDTCNVMTGLCEQTNADPGTACVADGSAFCDDLDTCDGSGTCNDDNANGPRCPSSQTCDAGEEDCNGCDDADAGCVACTGTDASSCPALTQEQIDGCGEYICNDDRCLLTSACTNAEACDGAGTCDAITDGMCCDLVTPDSGCSPTDLGTCTGSWETFANPPGSCSCPKYAYGTSDNADLPPGSLFLLQATEQPCTTFNRVGDDYTLANGSYLAVEEFRFLGGADGTGDGTVVFEFYDGAFDPPILVAAFAIGFAAGDPGIAEWSITLGAPIVVPPTGYIVARPGTGSGETVNVVSALDDGDDTGSNNPNLMWVNSGPDTFLQPDAADILTFALYGSKVLPPTGSCCVGGGCDDTVLNVEWACEDGGGVFVPGVACASNPCAVAPCCNDTTGVCTIEDPGDCTAGGGTPGAPGSTCTPNCCAQPNDESANGCFDAPTIDLDANGGTYTWTGDNSDAVNGVCEDDGTTPCRLSAGDGEDCPVGVACLLDGDCGSFGNDPLKWISFSFAVPSIVQIDYCCTDEASRTADVRYVVVNDACPETDSSDCGATIFRDGACPTGCPDGNPCDEFTLGAGTYWFPLNSDRYCDGTTTNCTTDADCGGAPGSCFDSVGPYQIHVTATPLPDQACCLGSVCAQLPALECTEMGGFPLDNTPVCLPGPANPCLLGSCCEGAGMCEDNGGVGIDEGSCAGLYIGGARCVEDDPCPICDIKEPANCQQDTGAFIVVNDRTTWSPGSISRWVDDFQATTSGPMTKICYEPAFFNPNDGGSECSGEGEPPPDDFKMRLYNDAGGLPGAEIGSEQDLTVIASQSNGGASRVWTYSFGVPVPPVLTGGQCYWLEVTGAGIDGGCTVYATLSADGNSYVVNDQDGVFGAEDVLTQIGDPPDPAVDLAFCVENGMSAGGCGEFTGACCLPPPAGCAENQTVTECIEAGGVFNPGIACAPDLCPVPCEADTCDVAVALTGPLPFSREFNTSFCDNPNRNSACDINEGDTGQTGTTPLGNATWFSYTTAADECGTLEISTCAGGSYDGAMAVWTGGCPATKSNPNACGDDTCGVGGGMPVVTLDVDANETIYVKMGGWQGETGAGTLVFTLINQLPECGTSLEAPQADNRFDVNGTVVACGDDAGCAGVSVCRDGECYVPTNRGLGIEPAVGGSYTYRVQQDTVVAGIVTLGFTGGSEAVVANGPGPSNYLRADVVAVGSAEYQDWGTAAVTDGEGYLLINDCEIAPDRNYIVQAIAQGDDTSNESNYSDPLALPTSKYGDATAGGAVNAPPGGFSNLVDVFAAVQAFQNTQGGPKHWFELAPSGGTNFPAINLADVFDFVDGFQNGTYDDDPSDCP